MHAKAQVTPEDITFMLAAKHLCAEPCIAACALPLAAVASSSKHALAIPTASACSIKGNVTEFFWDYSSSVLAP